MRGQREVSAARASVGDLIQVEGSQGRLPGEGDISAETWWMRRIGLDGKGGRVREQHMQSVEA